MGTVVPFTGRTVQPPPRERFDMEFDLILANVISFDDALRLSDAQVKFYWDRLWDRHMSKVTA